MAKFKVGDLVRVLPVPPEYSVSDRGRATIGKVGQVVELCSRDDSRWLMHKIAFERLPYKADIGEPFLEKVDPPREDLKVVKWENIPWWKPERTLVDRVISRSNRWLTKELEKAEARLRGKL